MNKSIYLILVVTLFLSLSFVSAATYSETFNHRYTGPSGVSSASYYYKNSYNYYNDGSGYYDYHGNYRYPIKRHANTPIFKGSYGNYRYQMYDNGDYRPGIFFVDYPESGYRPYFSGGSGYGYRGGYGGGLFGLGYSSYNYYPSYSYSYSGRCGYYC